jgi:hypothetical protein
MSENPMMRPGLQRLAALAIAAVLVNLVGCGGAESTTSANFSTVDARGTITRAGQPIARGIVTLVPSVDGGSTQQAMGEIQAGSFTLNSGGGKSGAMPGKYTVKLEDALGTPVSTGPQPVTVEVPSGGGDLAIAIP